MLVLSTTGCNFFGHSGSNSTTPGGDDGPKGDSEGFFVDSGVEGLTYTASPSGVTGTTDADGRYEYNAGDTITFSIGSIELGSSSGAQYITPMTFNPDDEEMGVRIAQLLQSMDSDKNPDNGITPDPAAIEALKDIDLTSDSFETYLRDKLPANLAFVERDKAMNHMETTFNTHAINPNGHNHTIPKIFPGYDSEHGLELWITKDGKTPEFVKELDEGGTLRSYPHDFTKVGDKIFFISLTPQYGNELWVTDGTEDGTHIVKDIAKGTKDSSIGYLTAFGDKVIFSVGPNYSNFEPWVSDGTPEGTFMLKDINEGPSPSSPKHFTVYDGKVYFAAESQNEGREVWSTDGTPEGTKILVDYTSGTNSSYVSRMAVADGSLWFIEGDSGGVYNLVRSDGTTTGTETFETDVRPNELAVSKDGLYYIKAKVNEWVGDTMKYTSGGNKNDLFQGNDFESLTPGENTLFLTQKINGLDAALTQLEGNNIKILRHLDKNFDGPKEMTTIGDTLFFAGEHSNLEGKELFKADGSTFSLVKDINPGEASSNLSHLTPMNEKLYFTATTVAEGNELWVSDGTEAGTHIVKDINPGTDGSAISSITAIDNKLYFNAISADGDNELWISDGTEDGTKLLININKEPISGLTPKSNIYRVGDKFVFMKGNEVWVSDGTAEGTADTGEASNAISLNADMGDYKVLLLRNNGSYKIMKTDGTLEGTSIIENFDDIDSDFLAVTGDKLFFVGSKASGETEKLYVSDGTADSAEPFLDADNEEITDVYALRGIDEMMLIRTVTHNSTENIYKLYASDGTSAGTKVLDEKTTEGGNFYYDGFVFAGGLGYYFNRIVETGLELWSTDGTKAGTVLVKNIADDAHNFRYEHLINVGERVYYILSDDENIYTLWKTDGTPESTEQVKVFEVTEKVSKSGKIITPLAVIGDKFYFTTLERYDDAPDKYSAWVIHNKTGMIQELDFDGLDLSNYDMVIPYGRTNRVTRGSEYMLVWLINKTDGSGKLIKVLGSSATVIQEANFIEMEQVS